MVFVRLNKQYVYVMLYIESYRSDTSLTLNLWVQSLLASLNHGSAESMERPNWLLERLLHTSHMRLIEWVIIRAGTD